MVVVLLVLLLVSSLQAQVNIEHYRGKMGITGGARFSLSSDLGNVDVVNSEGAGNLTVNTTRGDLALEYPESVNVESQLG